MTENIGRGIASMAIAIAIIACLYMTHDIRSLLGLVTLTFVWSS